MCSCYFNYFNMHWTCFLSQYILEAYWFYVGLFPCHNASNLINYVASWCHISLQISKVLAGAEIPDKKDLMRKLPKFIYDEEKALEVITMHLLLRYLFICKASQCWLAICCSHLSPKKGSVCVDFVFSFIS